MNYQTITITFGEQAVTHIGMETIGEVVEEGFTIADLENAKLILESKGAVCERDRHRESFDYSKWSRYNFK
jgi:hypothetical protein